MTDYNKNGQGEFDDSFLSDISDSIAKQVQDQMNSGEPGIKIPNFDYVDDILGDTTMSLTQDFRFDEEKEYVPLSRRREPDFEERGGRAYSSSGRSSKGRYGEGAGRDSGRSGGGKKNGRKKKENFWTKMPGWGKVLTVIGGLLIVLILAAVLYYNYLLNLVDYRKEDDFAVEETTDPALEESTDEFDPNAVEWNNDTVYRHEEGVLNFLLVGEENMGNDLRGRTDSIMIVSLNQNTKTISLTSIMRDCYVQIPDYQGKSYRDNKINAAYTFGGMTLTKQTIEENFNIQIDGYAKVDYDGFEQLIDALGGVEITLSQAEANYLNRTNYISKKSNRNVKEGKQVLNGNQALGYSRVRYVKTPEGLTDDWGRTARQRKVLDSLFEKYKSKSIVELALMLPKVLELVSTDLNKTQITSLLATVVSMKPEKLETKSIPVDGGWTSKRISGVGDSLVLDMNTNIDALHKFIFGTTTAEKAILDAGGTLETTTEPASGQ